MHAHTSARAYVASLGISATEFEVEPIQWLNHAKVLYSQSKMASDALVEMRVDRILVWLERQSNSAMEGAIAALDDMPLLVGPIGVLLFLAGNDEPGSVEA